MATDAGAQVQSGHPKGLYLLFVTEMAERFSYYGMRALFTLYLVAAFFTSDVASNIYGSYTGLVYLTPLLGGYIADRFWGNRRSIIVGGLIMALGQFLMFLSACFVNQSIFVKDGPIDPSVDNGISTFLLFCGLVALILGNGFFKPNISTMVGDLYDKTDKRRDSAFTIFYMGINVGAFFAPIVCGGLGEGDWDNLSPFKWGFLCACIAMLLSVTVFWLLKDKYLVTPEGEGIGLPPKRSQVTEKDEEKDEAEKQNVGYTRILLCGAVGLGLFGLFYHFGGIENFNDYISYAIYAISVALPLYIITDSSLTTNEKKHIGLIYIIAVFVIFFWSAFEQAGSSLTLFAKDQINRDMFGEEGWFQTSWFQSINPFVVVCFAPLLTLLWQFLSSKGREPASLYKQAIGLALLSIGYIVLAYACKDMTPGVKMSMLWVFLLYFIHTMGELCLSPIGLSLVTKLSPKHLASLLMGVWFLSNAASNIFGGKLAALLPKAGQPPKVFLGFEIATFDQFFLVFAVMAGGASIILFAICPFIKKLMADLEENPDNTKGTDDKDEDESSEEKSDEKKDEEKPSEEKSDDKKDEEKPSDEKSDDKKDEEKSSDDKKDEDKPSEEKSDDKKDEDKPSEEKSDDKKDE